MTTLPTLTDRISSAAHSLAVLFVVVLALAILLAGCRAWLRGRG